MARSQRPDDWSDRPQETPTTVAYTASALRALRKQSNPSLSLSVALSLSLFILSLIYLFCNPRKQTRQHTHSAQQKHNNKRETPVSLSLSLRTFFFFLSHALKHPIEQDLNERFNLLVAPLSLSLFILFFSIPSDVFLRD